MTILRTPGESTRFFSVKIGFSHPNPPFFSLREPPGLSLACGSLDSRGGISTYSKIPDSTWKWYTFSLFESRVDHCTSNAPDEQQQ